jgi:predicted CXXCH cytochrome family protein
MEVLLREIQEVGAGRAEARERDVAAREITIGCAADQLLQLLGEGIASRHAVIKLAQGRLVVSCTSSQRILLNGKETNGAPLEVGDRLELGGSHLLVAKPPAGFDAALEIRASKTSDPRKFEAAFRTDLDATWLSKRRAAWLIVLVVAAGTFVIPYLAARGGRAAARLPNWVPKDHAWSIGPLQAAHQYVAGGKCQACHAQLFEVVQDQACVQCHASVRAHVTAAHLALTSLGASQPCTTCHREHQDVPEAFLDRGDGRCIACHADAARTFGSLARASVTGFGEGRHPAVKPNLASTAGSPPGAVEGPLEQTNLRFSHALHLEDEGVAQENGGQALACSDCHRLATGGEHFEPITMATRCARCHKLTFDPSDPDRQLPHGKQPREIAQILLEYFSRKFTDPALADKSKGPARRIPGQPEDRGNGSGCDEPVYKCARRAAEDELKDQVTKRGCFLCHAFREQKARDLIERFTVEPIHLTDPDYYPAARFPHDRHLVVRGAAGDAACLTCHPARSSKVSADVLVPTLNVCEGCHSDRPVPNQIEVKCVSCHDYHPHGPTGTLAKLP